MSLAWLAAPLVTAAWCWRLERRDGTVVCLTSHDRDLVRGNQNYRAAPGMRPSRIEQHDRIESQNIDVAGAISSSAIRSEDIASGRWDGARLELWLADWADPDAAMHFITAGELGGIVRRGQGFSAELAGPLAGLDLPAVPLTSPTCRAALGDRHCRASLALLTVSTQVIAIDGRSVIVTANLPSGDFRLGRLRWLSGPSAGLETGIIDQDGSELILAEVPTSPSHMPARVRLRAGCDKRLQTCAARFSNAVNFRGEAHLPGFDLLTRYPGG